MKNTIRLNESQLTRLVSKVLKEQFNPSLDYFNKGLKFPHVENVCSKKNVKGCTKDGIYSDFDKDYDYKLSKGVWYTKRKNTTDWIDLTNHPNEKIRLKSLEILNNKIDKKKRGENFIDNDNVNTLTSPFKNKNEANLFRKFVNKNYSDISKKYGLKLIGPHNSSDIVNSGNEIILSKKYGKIKLSDLFFKLINHNVKSNEQNKEQSKTLPSLIKTGFKIDKSTFSKNLGYFIRKCSQVGCSEFTYDMIGAVFGDAWQAYSKFQQFASVTPDLVKKMTNVFNNINKDGMPVLNGETVNDSTSNEIIKSLIPSNQSQFNSLPLGAVVGLYYPDSSNFDLAFFQSAIGRSRDNEGKWVQLRKPYFCKQKDKCDETLWKPSDIKRNITFVPNQTLRSGKSFIPTTHIGFIGHIDDKGERYVVHNVHQQVFAFPISKMNKNTLSIVWSGVPKIK